MRTTIQPFKTKSQLAYRHLRSDIIEGTYQPGEKLVIKRIAKKFGMSDIPIREALKGLEHEGFVENIPHVGFLITDPNFEQQRDVFEVRKLLECRATELAATKISSPALTKLKELLSRMQEVCDTDLVMFSRLNHKFHDTIYVSCENHFLYELINQIWSVSARTRSIFTLVPGRAQESMNEHEKIFSSLVGGDAVESGKAMARHQTKGYELLCHYRGSNVESTKVALQK